jgi:hypothetical protein
MDTGVKIKVVLVPLAIVLSSCGHVGSSTGSSPSSLLGALRLRLSDVPQGFYLRHTFLIPVDRAASWQALDPALYSSHGGGPLLEETFVLKHPVAEGLSFIGAQITSFKTPQDAAWGFRQLSLVLRRSGTVGTLQELVDVRATPTPLPTIIDTIDHPLPPPISPYQPARVQAMGVEAAGFTNTSAAYAGEYVFTNQAVLFHLGRYCALVHVSGNYAQVPMSAARSLVKRVIGRIDATSP